MVLARKLLPTTFAIVALAACGGGNRDEGTETASVDTGGPHRRLRRPGRHDGPRSGPGERHDLQRLGSENRIAEPTFQFAPVDTVYVSVGIQGAPAESSVGARWLAQGGKTLDSTTQAITAGEHGNQGIPSRSGEGVGARDVHGDALPERRLGRGQDVRGAEGGGVGPDRHRHEVTLSVAPRAVTLSAAKGA